MYTVERVYNLKWDNPEHSTFTCMVKFAEFNEDVPFTADPNDIYEHSKTIWNNGVNGVYGMIAKHDTE